MASFTIHATICHADGIPCLVGIPSLLTPVANGDLLSVQPFPAHTVTAAWRPEGTERATY